jgi:phage recombination protein Bet
MAQSLSIASRIARPANFQGTPVSWRVLCDLYPAAESAEIIGAVIDYCAVRRLDPFKKPVHIVPMYNARLRRKVQVVMQGINEVEITAARTGKWAGMDPPKWGPTIERTFRGSIERDNGDVEAVEVTLSFPEWCSVTVYRIVGGEPRGFTEQLWWEDCYARAGFRSEVPNMRWQQARRQMLHKCTKAASLRAAFPEEGFDNVAEEMEGRETDGGITIDGVGVVVAPFVEPGQDTGKGEPQGRTNGGTAPDARVQGQTSPASAETREAQTDRMAADWSEPTVAHRLANEPDSRKWLLLMEDVTAKASTLDDLTAIATHNAVRDALDKAPTLIQAQIREALRKAHERLAPAPGISELAELIAEVETMDLTALAGLPTSANWQALTRELIPPDFDRLDEAIAARKAALQPREAEKGAPDRDDHTETTTNAGL